MTHADPSLEARLRQLEASSQIQEDILVAMQAERIEAERLNEQISGLREGVLALGDALLQVDKTQQQLTQLGQQLTEVEESSVSKAELERAEKLRARKALEFRKKALARITSTSILLGLALLAGLVFFLEYGARQDEEAQQVCLGRQFASATVNTFTESQIAIERDNLVISDAVRNRRIDSLRTLGSAFPSPECKGSP